MPIELGIHPRIWRKQKVSVSCLKEAVKEFGEVNVVYQWVKLTLNIWNRKWCMVPLVTWPNCSHLLLSLSLYEEWLLAIAVCCNICLPPPRSRKCPGTVFLCCWRHIDPALQPGAHTRHSGHLPLLTKLEKTQILMPYRSHRIRLKQFAIWTWRFSLYLRQEKLEIIDCFLTATLLPYLLIKNPTN